MHFILILLTLPSLIFADNGGTTTTTAINAEESCLASCSPTDVNCKAICVGVPHPGAVQMNETTQCISLCPQGNGSPADSQAYASCQNACISSYIITSGTAAPGGVYSTAGVEVSTSSSIVSVTSGTSTSGTGTTESTSSKGWAAAPTAAVGGAWGLLLAAVALL